MDVLQPCCLVLAQKKSKYYSSISCLGTRKVEILQYYLTACRALVVRVARPCHGLSTLLVELVVFDIGKVEEKFKSVSDRK